MDFTILSSNLTNPTLLFFEMGITTARRISAFRKYGWFVALFAIFVPVFNGCLAAILSGYITDSVGNRFMFAILAASASYIAVPAAMKIAAPKADPGLYIPMAIGITFPFKYYYRNATLLCAYWNYIIHLLQMPVNEQYAHCFRSSVC